MTHEKKILFTLALFIVFFRLNFACLSLTYRNEMLVEMVIAEYIFP